jgi:hypothetical protein
MGDEDPLAPIDGCSLATFAEINRALVRLGAGRPREVTEVLAGHGVAADRWPRIHEAWTLRIREHRAARAAFRKLYAVPESQVAD